MPVENSNSQVPNTHVEGEAGKETNTTEQTNQPVSFEAWLEKQDDSTKQLYEEHVKGLKNTVIATRTERDDLKKEIGVALAKAEKGSQLETTLKETLTKLEVAEKKADFLEDAVRPEIGCKNPRAAFALAKSEDLFTRNGAPDWNAIKEAAPELFGKSTVQSNAGNGTEEPPKNTDMNTLIRQKAGY